MGKQRGLSRPKQGLRCQLAEQGDNKTEWPAVLQRETFAHNSLQNSSTKYSPHELMYGTKLRSLIDVAAEVGPAGTKESQSVEEPSPRIGSPVEKWELAKDNIEQAKESYKNFYDRRTSATRTELYPGEAVYLRNFTREDGLDPVYQGPYSVIDFKYPNVKIQREGGKAT